MWTVSSEVDVEMVILKIYSGNDVETNTTDQQQVDSEILKLLHAVG